jgi:quinol monooxygenase YgiN
MRSTRISTGIVFYTTPVDVTLAKRAWESRAVLKHHKGSEHSTAFRTLDSLLASAGA